MLYKHHCFKPGMAASVPVWRGSESYSGTLAAGPPHLFVGDPVSSIRWRVMGQYSSASCSLGFVLTHRCVYLHVCAHIAHIHNNVKA